VSANRQRDRNAHLVTMPPLAVAAPPDTPVLAVECIKVRYASEGEARAAMARHGHRGWYRCRLCQAWHTTSQRVEGRVRQRRY